MYAILFYCEGFADIDLLNWGEDPELAFAMAFGWGNC